MKATDAHGMPVELTRIAGVPGNGVLRTDRGTVVVEGSLLQADGVPAGEAVVEVTGELLREAARAFG